MEQLKNKLEQSKLLTEQQVDNLADTAITILLQEPNLIELQSPQYVIGDIHGQFYDFMKMMKEVSIFMLMQFLRRVLVSFWEIMSIEVITQFRLSAICWCLNV